MNTEFTPKRKQAQNDYFIKKWRNLTLLTFMPTLVAIVGTVFMWNYAYANNYQTDATNLLGVWYLTILAAMFSVFTFFCLFRAISEYRRAKD